ncbi:MAG: autotransporter outer membrane beta-barrel domain-containing protein [Rhizobiaceae bacterium]
MSLISDGDGENSDGGDENDEDGGWQAWATGFGGQLELDGSDRNALDTTVPYTGLSAGIIRALGDTDLGVNGAVSFSFGSLQSNMDFNSRWMRSQESDVQTIFTGVAASFAPGASPAGGLQIGASLRVGRTRLDNTRHVNNNLVSGGIANNIGSTDSLWLAVAGDIGYRIAAGDVASITPFARVSHVQGTIDGYSETGGQSAAIVGDQEIAVTRGEAGLRGSVDLAVEVEARLLGSVSAFFSSESGDDSVAVTLGTDNRDLVFTQLDDNGVRASLGLEYGFDNGTSLFAGGNYSASDAGDTDLSAGLTLRFPL